MQPLRHVRIDLVEYGSDEAMPYNWAGFTLQGEGASTVPLAQ